MVEPAKAPWQLDEMGYILAKRGDGEVHIIGRVDGVDKDDQEGNSPELIAECEATARLILTAPELLEACRKIKAAPYGVAVGDLEYLEDAIKKVEGK